MIAYIFIFLGLIFIFFGTLGIIRFPDLFTRMHATTKASSFGADLMLLAVVLEVQEFWIIFEAIIVILFIFVTAPVASHMIGRAAYFLQIPLWEKNVVDELHNKYDLHKHTLASESTPQKDT